MPSSLIPTSTTSTITPCTHHFVFFRPQPPPDSRFKSLLLTTTKPFRSSLYFSRQLPPPNSQSYPQLSISSKSISLSPLLTPYFSPSSPAVSPYSACLTLCHSALTFHSQQLFLPDRDSLYTPACHAILIFVYPVCLKKTFSEEDRNRSKLIKRLLTHSCSQFQTLPPRFHFVIFPHIV